MNDTPKVKETWVCVGRDLPLQDGTRGIEFRVLLPESDTRKTRTFGIKKFRSVRVGQVYEIEVSNDGGFCTPSTLSWIGQHADREEAVAWEAEDAARQLEKNRTKLLRDAKKNSALADLLWPVRNAYLKSNNRDAFALVVLRYLRSGKVDG